MQKLFSFFVALLVVSLPPVAVGESNAPAFTLQTSAGESVSLAEVSTDKPVVLFFWATWCPYCKALMPHLQSIKIEYGDAVDILAIQVFDDESAQPVLDEAGYDFLLLVDGDDVAELYGVSGTPGVFVVDTDQRIRFNLNDTPDIALPFDGENAGHRKKAAYKAPWWAARLRKALDETISN